MMNPDRVGKPITDILFLIDGTKSMEPHIEKVRGKIMDIVNAINEMYSDWEVRLGYVVYR